MANPFNGDWDLHFDSDRDSNIVITPVSDTAADVKFQVASGRHPSTTPFPGKNSTKKITFVEPLGGNRFRFYEGELILDGPPVGPFGRGIVKGRYATLTITSATTATVDDSGDWTSTRPPIT
jgi:hypothetical protein